MDRVQIERWKLAKSPVREMARVLPRSKATIIARPNETGSAMSACRAMMATTAPLRITEPTVGAPASAS
uniref:helix-turn-helix domain-containing protein n=1 Tax=Salipiger pallidus TaxID=1775170 RepID=UPI001663805F